MDNLPRLLFYGSGVFIISTAFTLFTTELVVFTNEPGLKGLLFLLGFGFIYMNIVFVSSRRYMRRENGPSPMPYIMAALSALPPVIWHKIKDVGLDDTITVYLLTIVVACALGGYFGHRAGLKAQAVFQQNLKNYINQDQNLPDDLKRPHDNLNKN